MIERVFTDEHKRKLIVRVNRSNIQIHTERKDLLDYRFDLNIELFKFLKEQAVKVWKTFTPKEADSFGADYWEFYDRNTDNNGYLEIRNELKFQSPNDETTLLYQFNKRRMESFIYDIESLIYRGGRLNEYQASKTTPGDCCQQKSRAAFNAL